MAGIFSGLSSQNCERIMAGCSRDKRANNSAEVAVCTQAATQSIKDLKMATCS